MWTKLTTLLNQVRAWFLEIAFVWEVGMRVCISMCKQTRNKKYIMHIPGDFIGMYLIG